MMGYAAGQPVLWPAPPQWSNPVAETLSWLTDQMQATGTGAQQVRALRTAPRRGFNFQTVANADARRIVDAVAFDIGVKAFLLPIYPDGQRLAAPLPAASTVVSCRTDGFDFVVGGKMALCAVDAYDQPQVFELATVADIAADSITLAAATANAWPVGSRVYPLRRARLAEAPQETQYNDDASARQVSMRVDEPCDWAAAWPSPALYRGVPVLEWRGNEATDPADQYDRASGSVDQDTGPVYYFDLPGRPFRAQSQLFTLYGRADHTRFRSFIYMLAGRTGQMWVPSWQADLRLVQPVAAGATQLQFGPCFYSAFGYQQGNRRDIRIELRDGAVLYRRITGSAQTANGETLQLDAALGRAVKPGDVRVISWLSMCQLATDTVTIQHLNDADGIATCQLAWQAVKSNV